MFISYCVPVYYVTQFYVTFHRTARAVRYRPKLISFNNFQYQPRIPNYMESA